MQTILKTKNSHQHEHVETGKSLVKQVRNECKCKVTNDIHEIPQKTMRKNM